MKTDAFGARYSPLEHSCYALPVRRTRRSRLLRAIRRAPRNGLRNAGVTWRSPLLRDVLGFALIIALGLAAAMCACCYLP